MKGVWRVMRSPGNSKCLNLFKILHSTHTSLFTQQFINKMMKLSKMQSSNSIKCDIVIIIKNRENCKKYSILHGHDSYVKMSLCCLCFGWNLFTQNAANIANVTFGHLGMFLWQPSLRYIQCSDSILSHILEDNGTIQTKISLQLNYEKQ